MSELGFKLHRTEEVRLNASALLTCEHLMSPFVWRDTDGGLSVLLRAVLPQKDAAITGTIWFGRSDDGLTFTMDDEPTLSPGPGPMDIGGCEDPTVVWADGEVFVYYTGVDAQGSGRMLYAAGPDTHHLTKRGVALASTKTERNTKEATVELTADGQWRLFYEYAQHDASMVGLAFGRDCHGPWAEQPHPFSRRPDLWDCWHLSTGPLLTNDPDRPVMFYNGADRNADWRIGWIAFDRACSTVTARCIDPLITPPPAGSDGKDIAFAASAIIVGDDIHLYYSRNDRKLFRAVVRQTGG